MTDGKGMFRREVDYCQTVLFSAGEIHITMRGFKYHQHSLGLITSPSKPMPADFSSWKWFASI
jgi:hypothetical protein